MEAYGEGLTYRWQVSTNSGKSWSNSSASCYNTPEIQVPIKSSNGGYRCKITDSSGNVVYSAPAQVKHAKETWTNTYDANGMRTQRKSSSATYSYIYNGSRLTQMTYEGNTLYFAYDASGTPMSVTYNGTIYYYATNLQGDIIAILNTNGTAVVTYTYDAWGNPLTTEGSLASTLGTHNPLRYRGYVYDTETGLYYLQSRYYSPTMGRFINGDDPAYLGVKGLLSYNLFAYCNNNPVMGYDPGGTWDWGVALSGASLLATGLMAISAAATILSCGAAAPLMVAVATVTLAAGTLTTVNGVAEVVEAGTGYNVVRDGAFGGDTAAYEAYRNTTSAIAEVGTAICGTYYAAKGGNVCFVAGTLIKAAIDDVLIEEISEGDLVWAWDEETGEVALMPVVETYVNETSELVHVFVNGEEIITTLSHPFYSPVKGWTEAVRLRAGDILVLVNGEYVVVEQVQHEILEAPITVYNFQVADYHTYYVSSNGVLVHNMCDVKSSIKYSNSLSREAGKLTGRLQDEADALIQAFRNGNTNPGLGVKHLSGDIYYLRGRNGARVFFRMVDGVMDILGKANKANEQTVIDLVLRIFGGK